MTSLKHFLCVYLLVGFSCLINAQSLPAYRVPLSDDGAIWVVKDIALDFNEYLWLIRNGQVYRFDGSSAVAVGQHISDWRPENPVGLVGTPDGRMYIAEQHRLGYIDLSDWTYHPIQTSFFDSVSQAQSLWIRAEGQQVIVGFDTGHVILVEGDRTEIFSDLVSQVSSKTGVLNPPVFGQGRWFIPFQWGKYVEFSPRQTSSKMMIKPLNFDQGLLYPMSRGSFLVHGGGRGMFLYEQGQLKLLDQYQKNTRLIVAQNESDQWVQVSPKGVMVFDEASIQSPKYLPFAEVLPDFNQVIYTRDQLVVAHDQGVEIFKLAEDGVRRFQPFPQQVNQSARGIHFFDQGDFFYGSYSGAVYVDQQGKATHFPKYTIVYALLPLDEDLLLIGNEGSVLDVFNRKTKTITPFFSSPIASAENPEFFLMSMARSDTDPSLIYLGGYDGIWTLNLASRQLQPLTHQGKAFSKLNRIRAIEVHQGVVTYSSHQGFFRYTSAQGPEQLFPEQGQSLVYDHLWSRDTLWLATQHQGLVAIDHGGRRLKSWGTSEGLVSDQVYGVTRAGSALYALTDRGYSVIDRGEIYSGLHGAQGQSSEFNHGAYGVHPQTSTLYAGGVRGWYMIPTAAPKESASELDIRLSEWSFSGPDHPLIHDFSLGYQTLSTILIKPENTFNQFKWTLNPLTAPKPSLRYRIPGVFDDWIPVTEKGNTELTFLGAGTYRLDLRPMGSSRYISVAIHKVPRLVERPLFWVLMLFLLGGIVSAIIWTRWKVVRDKERLRTAIAADLHDEIGSLLGGIMSQAQLADIVPEKIPQIIDKIKISSKKGLESLSDIVWSIDQHHDHWQGLFERMEAHGQEVARTKGWIFSFVVTGTVPEGPMPQLVRQNMWMMFKEMVHNSAKHAQATRVANNIHVDLTGRISWTYADNGPGFDFDRSYTGNGIKNLKMRAQKMKAEFFYSHEGDDAAYHTIIH